MSTTRSTLVWLQAALSASVVTTVMATCITVVSGDQPSATSSAATTVAAAARAAELRNPAANRTRVTDSWTRVQQQRFANVSSGTTFEVGGRVKAARGTARTRIVARVIHDGKVTDRDEVLVRSTSSARRVVLSVRAAEPDGVLQILARRQPGRTVIVGKLQITTAAPVRVPDRTSPPKPPPSVPTPSVPTPSVPTPSVPTPSVPTPSVPTPVPTPVPSVPTPVPTPAPAQWTQDLDEQFNTLNTTRWNVRNNTWADNENSYMLSRNTTVNGGVLRIQGKLENAGGRNFTSGYVDTMGKYTLPAYFRAEVRAKVPFEQGLWAAPLWFRPTDGGAGEIDLIETYGKERARPLIHQTIHTEYGPTHQQKAITYPYSSLGTGSATDWHVYTIEKTPGKIVMWTDGKKTAEFTSANPSWFTRIMEAGKRWNLRVNMQIGGTWGGLPDSSTDWSPDKSAMQLDYIKTWVPAS